MFLLLPQSGKDYQNSGNLKERERVVSMNNGVAVHGNNTSHAIQWKDAEILTKEQN